MAAAAFFFLCSREWALPLSLASLPVSEMHWVAPLGCLHQLATLGPVSVPVPEAGSCARQLYPNPIEFG